ncbi:MAG: hypothetical protein RRY16_01755 [Bacilli bacterium]
MYKYKRILVISNNPFSTTQNNGKTLASFFEEVPSEYIAELFFRNDSPSWNHCKRYFKISEQDLLNKGKCISGNGTNNKSIRKGNLIRIGRELIWKICKWKTKELINWLDDYNPEIIFFDAGDSGFAYDICDFIVKRYSSKLFVYFTDDYILPRICISPFWWIRRNHIYLQMKKILSNESHMIAISDEMQKEYMKIFNKKSIKLINTTESMKENVEKSDEDKIIFTYAGTFSFHRDETINLLIKAIKLNNSISSNKKAYLQIFSTASITAKMKSVFNVKGVSSFNGNLDSNELKTVLNQSDVLVHVESFRRNSIASTRLSISTKIPEYLSVGKCIVAIGPAKIASMTYLSNCAICINDKKQIYESITNVINNCVIRNNVAEKALNKYDTNHNAKKIRNSFMGLLFE